MGREWCSYLSPAKSTRRGRGLGGGSFADNGGDSGSRNSAAAAAAAAAAGAGCITTLLHLFDVHHFPFHSCSRLHQHPHHFPSPSPSFLSDADDQYPVSLKGLQAPRNSLESDQQAFKPTASLASITEETGEQTFDVGSIPMGIYMKNGSRRDAKLRVRVPSNSTVGKGGGGDEFSSSESSSSPGPRTPNLVARLMGLDLLPDANSTSNNVTPRSSSSSSSLMPPRQQPSSPSPARSSDVYGHRLSLQIPKENRLVSAGQLDLPRHSWSAISTRGSYARQMVKQAKENVMARKFGSDITNKDEKIRETRRDEHLIMITSLKDDKKKSQKGNTKTSVIEEYSLPLENSTPCRPAESKRKLEAPPPPPIARLSPPHLDLIRPPIRNWERRRPNPFSRAGRSRPGPSSLQGRPKKLMDSVTMNKDHELFIRRSSPRVAADQYRRADKMGYEWKRPMLLSSTSDIVPPAATTSLSRGFRSSSFKKLDSCASSSPAPTTADVPQRVLQKKDKLLEAEAAAGPETQSRSHYFDYCNKTIASYRRSSTGTNARHSADFECITPRLNRAAGIHRNVPISITDSSSSTQQPNPSMFHDLEAAQFTSKSGNGTNSGSKDHHHHHHYSRLGHDRRLLFDLVDDALLETTYALGAFEEIAELISLEIEYDMVDSLVRELAAPNCMIHIEIHHPRGL